MAETKEEERIRGILKREGIPSPDQDSVKKRKERERKKKEEKRKHRGGEGHGKKVRKTLVEGEEE